MAKSISHTANAVNLLPVVVPVYRVIYEPLRTYLLYSTALAALRGREVGWKRVRRTGSVPAVLAAARRSRPVRLAGRDAKPERGAA
jgi:biofilm PGA synthesis N-glycosyltransferase PgaC